MRESVFSFFMSEKNTEIAQMPVKYRFGTYFVAVDTKTPYDAWNIEQRECVVFGLAVDVCTKNREDIARRIVENCFDIKQVVDFEKQLGGKYIILFRCENEYYVLGDATCSIPIFYNIDRTPIITSNYQYILREIPYTPDCNYQKIRDSSEISQAMPYDITVYSEIKQLLPNHYLNVEHRKTVRFVNAQHVQRMISAQQAAEITAPMIDVLADFYMSKYKLYCPITSGRDSRVVLSFLAKRNADIPCYTIRHPEHQEDAQDLVVPVQLCKELNLKHELICDTVISEELQKEMDELLGRKQYAPRTLRIAQTVKEHYGDGAIINGDIIGQVGKCSLHRDIPERFATARYFRCKLHNYSKGALTQLQYWLREIENSGECVNRFDLFSVENRMGRWAGQENLVYNSLGQFYLNLFNSRSIIYTWILVNRSERKESRIHTALMEESYSDMMFLSYEMDRNIITRIAKLTGWTYLISSYVKSWMERLCFKLRSKNEKNNYYC